LIRSFSKNVMNVEIIIENQNSDFLFYSNKTFKESSDSRFSYFF
jgi:hypothetical protein